MKRDLRSLVGDQETLVFETKLISLEKIKESPTQARTQFNTEDLNGLAESIRSNGILQPLVVQIAQDNTYKLIAGERRLRASKIAGLKEVPCVVKDVSKRDAAVMGIVENIQREKLSPVDESQGFRKLIEDYGLNITEVGLLVGKSRPYISNSLRLSGLIKEIVDGLSSNEVKVGQVRPLISLSEDLQKEVYKEIRLLNLSSREVEEKVSNLSLNKANGNDEELLHAKRILEDFFGKPISIKKRGPGGKIEIGFSKKEDLKSILEKLV
tara:strand:+ start:1399 stop:2202 length:804 start_codon:yes stop_codon:yes gene_type:complete